MTRAPRRRISLATYRRITLLALVALAVIVVSGAAVRLSGSGLGCEDWPNCTQKSFVAANDFHQRIEQYNRMFTGVVSVSVVLAVLGSLALAQRRRDLTFWSLGLVAGVAGQIVLGGLVVLFDLSPWLVLGHFALSMVLVWNAVVLHHRAGATVGRRVSTLPPRLTALSRALVVLSMVVIFSGTIVTGAGPHSGSRDDEPIERLPFAVHNVVRVHGVAMVVFLATTVLFAFLVRPGTRHASAVVAERTRRELTVVLTVLVAQAAIGYIQYFSDVPPLLVGIHVAGATTLWITVVLFHLRRFAADPAPATSSAHEAMPHRSVDPAPETLIGSAPSHRLRSAPVSRVPSAPSHRLRSAPSHRLWSARGVANPPAAPET